MQKAGSPASPVGFHPGLPWDEYFALDGLNASSLAHIAKSPYEYRYRLQFPPPDTDTFRRGRATHAAVFEPDVFEAEYVATAMRRDERSAKYQEFLEEHRGKTILTKQQWEDAAMAAKAIRKRPYVRSLLSAPGHSEVTFTWSTVLGRRCKTRIDHEIVHPTEGLILMELKTASKGIDAASFARSVSTYGYHWKAAWHRDAVYAVTGELPAHYYFLVVEPFAPYAAAIYRLEDDALAVGRREYEAMLGLLAACERADEWPDRSSYPAAVGIPSWHRFDLVPAPEVAS